MGKNCLVTGGAGSIGSALVKELLRLDTKTVRVFDNNEYALFKLKQELTNPKIRLLLGDIRDRKRVILALKNIDIVFHIAAIKNIEISEYNYAETVRTNIDGTINLIECSMQTEPEHFIFISSDKACNYSNFYGATKFVGEKLCLWANQISDKTLFSVCFHPSTRVLTNNGYKPISTIKAGDFVLSHNLRFRKVIRTFKRWYKGKLLQISDGKRFILVTPEHPLLVLNNGSQGIHGGYKWSKAEVCIRKGFPFITYRGGIHSGVNRRRRMFPIKDTTLSKPSDKICVHPSYNTQPRYTQGSRTTKVASTQIMRNVLLSLSKRTNPPHVGNPNRRKTSSYGATASINSLFNREKETCRTSPQGVFPCTIQSKNGLLGKNAEDKRRDISLQLDKPPRAIKTESGAIEFVKARDTKLLSYAGTVCNLEVEQDNSYVAEGFFAHNCRFGNVKDSRGNVFEIWREQLKQGKPLTVTHEKARRFFWSSKEAVDFIIKCSLLTKGGEIFVPEMEEYTMMELAKELSSNIKITGLRKGEKIVEELMTTQERKQAKYQDGVWIIK